MAIDKNGNELKVGDKVLLEGVVKDYYGKDYVAISLPDASVAVKSSDLVLKEK